MSVTITGRQLGVQLYSKFPDEEDHTPPRCEAMKPVKNSHVKPTHDSGLWTSTFTDEPYESDWIDWCRSERYGLKVYPDGASSEGVETSGIIQTNWLLTPLPTARIYEIDTYADLEQLVQRFPYKPFTDFPVRMPEYIDFEMARYYYDAIHLTDAGQWATRLSHPLNLYGWDCESTLWLHWAFLRVEPLGREIDLRRNCRWADKDEADDEEAA